MGSSADRGMYNRDTSSCTISLDNLLPAGYLLHHHPQPMCSSADGAILHCLRSAIKACTLVSCSLLSERYKMRRCGKKPNFTADRSFSSPLSRRSLPESEWNTIRTDKRELFEARTTVAANHRNQVPHALLSDSVVCS